MKFSGKYGIFALFFALCALAGAAFATTGDGNIVWTDGAEGPEAVLSGDHAWDTDDAAKSPVKIDLKGYTLDLSGSAKVISGDGVTVTSTSGDAKIKGTSSLAGISGAKLVSNFEIIGATSADGYLWVVGAKKEAVEGASTDLTVRNVTMAGGKSDDWRSKQFKIAGGGWNTAVDLSSATVTVEDSIVGHSVYGGSMILTSTTGVSVDKTLVNINSGAKVVRSVYGGGESRKADTISTVGQSHIIVNKGASIPGTYSIKGNGEDDKLTEKGYVYGGGNAEGGISHVKNAIIEIKGGTVAHVRGGGRIETAASVSSVDVAEIRLIGEEGLKAVSDVKAGGEAATGEATPVGSATIELYDIPKTPVMAGVTIDGSGTEKGTTLKFTRVKADLSALTISSMDILVVDSGSKVTINDLGGAKTIMVTGDFNKMPATNILTIKNAAIAAKVDVIIAADNLKEYKWDNGSLMVMGRDSGVAEPVKPELPKDTPAEVKPVEAKIYAVAPDATPAEKNNVIRDASEKLEGISSGDLVVDASGAITVKAETVRNAASSLVAYNETITKVGPLPVFSAEVAKAQTAAVAYKIKGKDLYATDPSKINVIKYLGSGEAARFVYAAAAADFADESYTVMLHGTSTIADSIAADTEYDLVLFIKDGGRFDLDKADAFVADPPAVVQTEKKASGGSSSGCNGGFGALLLLGAAMLPLVYRKKR